MLANILLVVTSIFYLGFWSVTASPAPGGDRGVGHAFVLVITGGGFILFSGLLAWKLAFTQVFDWIPVPEDRRGWMIFGGWVVFAVSVMAASAFRSEWHPGELPDYLRWLAVAQAGIWLPLLVLGPLFWLLNTERQAGVVPDFVKIPFQTGFMVCGLMVLGLLIGYFRSGGR